MNASLDSPKRAILLFTRSPENEARNKPLSSRLSLDEHVELYELFTRHVLKESSRLDCPVLIATDEPEYDFTRFSASVAAVFPQHGEAFGERFTTAIAAAFNLGYDEIVCVGNDCLDLTVADFKNGFEKLSSHPLVLGAAADGGVYLIGIQRRSSAPALQALAKCRWQTAFVLQDLLLSTRAFALNASILRKLADIDNALDLITAGARLSQLDFLNSFVCKIAFASHRFSFPLYTPSLSHHVDLIRLQKAPPLAWA